MSDQVGVRHAELVTHAGHVETTGDRVATAASAGAAVRAGNDAYGKLCVMVPVMLNALQDVLIDGIDTAAGSLHDTAARLRTTASEYQSADQRRAAVFKGIGGDR
jgi:excreted virulence factor EspC (type VII ESX diderm)